MLKLRFNFMGSFYSGPKIANSNGLRLAIYFRGPTGLL